VNTEGSFKCLCQPGFLTLKAITDQIDGSEPQVFMECVDINECDGMSDCDDGERAICENTVGSYSCTCKDGYEGDGKVCTEKDEVKCEPDCQEGEFCQLNGDDEKASCECVSGMVPNPAYNETNCDCAPVVFPAAQRKKRAAIADAAILPVDDTDTDGLLEDDVVIPEGGEPIDLGDDAILPIPIPPEETCLCATRCIDVPECDKNPCDENAGCTELYPGHSCKCNSGFQGNGVYCDDVDECALELDNCNENAICTNTIGSFTCECKLGYTGDGVTNCTLDDPDVDVCGCGESGICNSQTLQCTCAQGYEADYTKETEKCEDVDECSQGDKCHPAANCTNLEGGYSCQCPPSMEGDGYNTCDTNECTLGTANCSVNAICTNTVGHYTCECKQGYEGDGTECTPEIDPCVENPITCGENAMCVGRDGEAVCECKAGYIGDGEECDDQNECMEDGKATHDCHENAACSNVVGGYLCDCLPGFIGNGKECEDVDECTDGTHSCSPFAYCNNTIGGFLCTCKEGFTGDGYFCEPDDACKDGCHANGECATTPEGGYVCQCKTGYTGDGNTTCDDVNECIVNNPCDENASCKNTEGSVTCRCNKGFRGNGYTCEDVNECLRPDVYECAEGAECNNTVGSYVCGCPKGYAMRNGTCIDVDECEDPRNICDENAVCTNLKGTYCCNCDKDHMGDGIDCQPCLIENIVQRQKRESLVAPTETTIMPCKSCPTGLRYNADKGDCENIDECSEHPNSIDADRCVNARCEDRAPGYVCICEQGYVPKSEHECEDFNECERIADLCGFHGQCYNTPGSYECVCAEGFKSTNGQGCVDINECTDIPDVCGVQTSAVCVNTDGSYQCRCRAGYTLDEVTGKCQDVNECLKTTTCGDEQLCINMPGGFRCDCQPGFRNNAGVCTNVDECSVDHPCHDQAHCVDTVGSYTCQCQDGFTGDGKLCTPICAPGVCPERQTCTVADGRPSCHCVCEGQFCANLGEVCGSDGNTYPSYATLAIYACQSDQNIVKAYDGKCVGVCDLVECPQWKQCITNENGFPVCQCQPVEEADWNSGYICMDSGVTYPSLAILKMYACARDSIEKIAYKGKCENARDCEYGHWAEWSGCSVTCGRGTRSRSRSISFEPEFGGKNCTLTVEKEECHKAPCKGDPCEKIVCQRPGSYCVSQNSEPRCVCPNCQYDRFDPVCGIHGGRMTTASNMCMLQLSACLANDPYEVLHHGACNDGEPNQPLECTVMPYYEKLTDTAGCVSKETIQTNTCKGGCGSVTGKCCVPKETEYAVETFVCPNQTVKQAKVQVVKSCNCIEEQNKPQPQPRIVDLN